MAVPAAAHQAMPNSGSYVKTTAGSFGFPPEARRFGYVRSVAGPERVGGREYANDEIVVEWHPRLCFHSLNCVRALPGVFDSSRRPWIDVGAASAAEIEKAVDGCPSSALRLRRLKGPATQGPTTVEMTPARNGPLLVRGPIRVVAADGSVEELERAAFCRCGQSKNKPFCDGSHREAGFAG
jgi:uncharacterized Fe-S cluster protein YjdI